MAELGKGKSSVGVGWLILLTLFKGDASPDEEVKMVVQHLFPL